MDGFAKEVGSLVSTILVTIASQLTTQPRKMLSGKWQVLGGNLSTSIHAITYDAGPLAFPEASILLLWSSLGLSSPSHGALHVQGR